MALDEPRNGDEVFKVRGLTYVIDKSLLNGVQPIEVDHVPDRHPPRFAVKSTAYRFSMRVFL